MNLYQSLRRSAILQSSRCQGDYLELILTFNLCMFLATASGVTAPSVYGRGTINQICAGLIQSYGVKRGHHAEVRHYGGVVMSPTVALRRNIHYQTNVEVRSVGQNCFSVLRNLVIEYLRGIPFRQNSATMLA